MSGLRLDFSKSPVIYDFIQSNAFVQGLMGPVGSGKSYGCASKIFIKAVQQKPSPVDNIRYSRWPVLDLCPFDQATRVLRYPLQKPESPQKKLRRKP